MTDTSKPPMVVWLDRYACSVQCLGFYAPKKESLHVKEKGGTKTFGPYVHMDQLLEEVEERSRYAHDNGLVGNPVLWALRDIVKELKEHNEN